MIVKWEWTTESFNKRTGNQCKKFKCNYFTNYIQ